ncbi:MAG: sensor histidine kinase [Bacteroidales bacterium]|nr:sensor histidine kinase [Bacteroidales bacterium]
MFKYKPVPSVVLLILVIGTTLLSCRQHEGPKTETGENQRFYKFIKQSKDFRSIFVYDSALLYADSAYALALLLQDKGKVADALISKGITYKNSGAYALAKTDLFRAKSICRQQGFLEKQARTEAIIGNYYLRVGENDSALSYQLTSIRKYECCADSFGLAKALNSLGSTYRQLGRHDEALRYFYRAESIYSLMGDVQRQAYVLNNIGLIHQFNKEYDKALKLFVKCRTVSQKAENHYMTMTSSMNIAGTYYFMDKNNEAERAYLEIIELNKKHPNDETLAAIYISLGAIYEEEHKPDLSFSYISKALQIAERLKNFRTETHATYKMAHYYLDKGKLPEAESYFKQTIAKAQITGDIQHLSHSYKNLAAMQQERGDLKNALANYKLSKELNDSIVNEKKLETIYYLESEFEKKKDEAEILRLSNENALQEIHNRDLKIVLLTIFCFVILLLLIIFLIRLKNRKDKIIAAQRIQQLEEKQKLLAAQSVLVGQENERKRIARELHDGIGVLLSTASIHFSNIEESSADEKIAQLLKKANKLLKEAGGQVRKISHDMMPGVLSKFGLQEALEDVFENVEDAGSIEVDCRIELEGERLNENLEIMLYRIVQEMLNNTLKHAGAKRISFLLKKEVDELLIRYNDDGRGFNQDEVHAERSLGLSGIKSRIDFLKGEMRLISSKGKGVQYEIRLPLR